MGLTHSCFNILSDKGENTVTTLPDGTIIERKKNPYIRALAVTAASVVLISFVDGGDGMISKSLGKVCLNCKNKIK